LVINLLHNKLLQFSQWLQYEKKLDFSIPDGEG